MSEFRFANAISDHIVLQRDEIVHIWGKGKSEGNVVYVSIGAYEAYGIVNDALIWCADLPPMPVCCEPQTLIATDGTSKISVEDVLIGDVWVVNGQSNAAATVEACNNNGKGVYNGEWDSIPANIRAIKQQRSCATNHPETMLTPQFDLVEPETSTWRRIDCEAEVLNMTAIGFFFAKKFEETFKSRIPIGIVETASGGSPMMELIMPELVAPMGYTVPEKKEIPLAGIYNALMAPVQTMTIKGMLFYQGESEQWHYQKYPYQLAWYVNELRKRFCNNFPFYYVQLSSHIGAALEGWPKIEEVRYAQTKLLGLLDNAYMVVSMDVGGREENNDWAHPPYKKPVAERLCNYVLANEYDIGYKEEVVSPHPCGAVFEDDKIEVEFDFVGEGLKLLKGKKLVGFEAAGEDGEYKPVDGKIDGEDVVVFTGIKKPVTIRYAHTHTADWDHANLGSSTDMPCVAFELYKDHTELLH